MTLPALWMLIIFGWNNAVEIPMADQEACMSAAQVFENRSGGLHTHCVNLQTGAVLWPDD